MNVDAWLLLLSPAGNVRSETAVPAVCSIKSATGA